MERSIQYRVSTVPIWLIRLKIAVAVVVYYSSYIININCFLKTQRLFLELHLTTALNYLPQGNLSLVVAPLYLCAWRCSKPHMVAQHHILSVADIPVLVQTLYFCILNFFIHFPIATSLTPKYLPVLLLLKLNSLSFSISI